MWSYPTTTGGPEVYTIEELTSENADSAPGLLNPGYVRNLIGGRLTDNGVEIYLYSEALRSLQMRYGKRAKFPKEVINIYYEDLKKQRTIDEWSTYISSRIFVLRKPSGKASVAINVRSDKVVELSGRAGPVHSKYGPALKQWAKENRFDIGTRSYLDKKLDEDYVAGFESLNRLKQLSGI